MRDCSIHGRRLNVAGDCPTCRKLEAEYTGEDYRPQPTLNAESRKALAHVMRQKKELDR